MKNKNPLSCIVYPVSCILFLATSLAFAQVDVFGYYEPQYTGLYSDTIYYQSLYNKLRVDLKSTAIKNTEFGADLIYTLYHGKKTWNILDFLPSWITSPIPPDMHSLYAFAFTDTFYLDNAYARLSFSRFAFTIGKQQISLGTGYFSNPIDVFNAKDALDPTYEQSGHMALRMDIFVGNRMNLMALYTPSEFGWRNSGKLARAKVGIGHFDFSLTGHEFQHTVTDFSTFNQTQQYRRLIGMDFVGELLGLGLWGEGTYNFMEEDDNFYEFIAGTDYTFENGLYAMLEYHRNSQGKSDYMDYDLNDWMRFFTGEIKTISQDQVYGLIQYPVADLIMVGSMAIFSISDRSFVIVPTFYINIFENVDLTLMLNFNIGDEGKVFSNKLGTGGFLRAQVYF